MNTILPGDVVVVLGGGLRPDGGPTVDTRERARAAVQLAAKMPTDTTFVFSGDGRQSVLQENSEAVLMYRVFMSEFKKLRKSSAALQEKYGILWEKEINRQLRIEPQSQDTVGNAAFVFHRFLRGHANRYVHVVTSPFHLARAALAFEGILGDAFTVVPELDLGIPDNPERAKNEQDGIEEVQRFCAEVTAGDSASVIERLLKYRPERYGSKHWALAAAAA